MIKAYQNAEKMLFYNTKDVVLNGNPKTKWIKNDSFVYKKEYRKNGQKLSSIIEVNCCTGEKKNIFNEEILLSELAKINSINYEINNIDIEKIQIDKNKVKFELEGYLYEYDKITDEISKHNEISVLKSEETLSPDGKYLAYVKLYNIYVKNIKTGEEIQITKDGEKYFDYGSHPDCRNTAIKDMLNKTEMSAGIIWSPDSKQILTYKLDQRNVKDMPVIHSAHQDKDVRPKLYTYKVALPGDEEIPLAYLYLCDITKNECIKLKTDPLYINFSAPFASDYKRAKWLDDSSKVYFTWMSRDFKEAKFNVIDANTYAVDTIVYEKSNTFLFLDSFGEMDGFGDYAFSNYMTQDGKFVIWQSEKDGIANYYLYDASIKCGINRINCGQYASRNIISVDEKNNLIYFMASGLKQSSDPYYLYLCRIKFDGSEFKVLTEEDASHSIAFSDSKLYFVDTYSRVDMAPVTILRDIDGNFITKIEEADISMLMDMGYIMPERFSLRAEDSETELYGIMIKPANFDENKKYPIIDYIYGGVQCTNVPKTFTWTGDEREAFGGLQSLVQLGFVGLIIDGRGTPQRTKKIHDYCYENLQGCAGINDHVYCTKKLAQKFEFIDIDKVGMFGASGGGCATARAMFEYPEFYKVGVSCCGNHNQSLYNACWVERYDGLYSEEVYGKQDNAKLAANLKGKLLLIHGDIDDNVHVSQTIRLVDALIRANKDFDMYIIPNSFHNVSPNKYVIRKRWDYFVSNLMGEIPVKEYNLV